VKALREHLVKHAEAISRELSDYTGKVYLEALMSEVFTVVDALRYYEKHAPTILKTRSVKTPLLFFGNRSYVEYKPLGVVAVISPWNFPFQLSLIPMISALIAGNCVLLKPSEVTPCVGELIERVFRDAGFPSHVVQVMHGGRNVGSTLIESRPDKIFFTGSVATGKKIMAAAAERLIPVELELGGKDPMIVFSDSDLERAANAAVWGAFTNAGQVCMSVERVYVERSVYDEFVRKVRAKTEALRLGVDYGSMTFPPQVELVQAHLEDALSKGAQIECGGSPLREGTLYFAPTVLTSVHHFMRVMREESFGPLLPIMPFDSENEAIELANDSDYGLNASVFSLDLVKARRVASQLISGNVCINEVIASMANPHLPFGGVKQSGMGRYHAEVGLQTFCHQTSVMASKGKKWREINWYPYTQEQQDAMFALVRLLYGAKRNIGWKAVRPLVRQLVGLYRKESDTPKPSGSLQSEKQNLHS
jgi:acyl-CoA reductase-like NAD-dependent aldehyde dehydrogenase